MRSCVRPACAVHMTAGPDIRERSFELSEKCWPAEFDHVSPSMKTGRLCATGHNGAAFMVSIPTGRPEAVAHSV